MSRPTWWLVITRPFAETIEPEPPVEKRTLDFCTCSSQASLVSHPYFFFSSSLGGLCTSHMPSAKAGALDTSAAMASNARSWDFCMVVRGLGDGWIRARKVVLAA